MIPTHSLLQTPTTPCVFDCHIWLELCQVVGYGKAPGQAVETRGRFCRSRLGCPCQKTNPWFHHHHLPKHRGSSLKKQELPLCTSTFILSTTSPFFAFNSYPQNALLSTTRYPNHSTLGNSNHDQRSIPPYSVFSYGEYPRVIDR
jgi:hypothetical protein